jgi:hypothetical protein
MLADTLWESANMTYDIYLRSMLADTLWESANMTYDIYALHGKWNPVKK